MLTIKLIGCVIIVISSSMLGIAYGSKFKDRYYNLILLHNCIQILETEIIYAANPLPEALTNVYHKGNKKISYIFEDIRKYLISDKNNNVLDSFINVLHKYKKDICINNEDIEVLLSLGRVLGTSDRIDQEKHIKTVLVQLKSREKEAELLMGKNEKLYKSLGVLSGLALSIILI